MVSRHRLEAVFISSSDAAPPKSGRAGNVWYSLSAVMRRKDACAGDGELCNVQSLYRRVSTYSKVTDKVTRSITPSTPPRQGFF